MASRLDRGQGHARSHELFKNYGAVRIRIQLERELSKPQKTRVQFFGARPCHSLAAPQAPRLRGHAVAVRQRDGTAHGKAYGIQRQFELGPHLQAGSHSLHGYTSSTSPHAGIRTGPAIRSCDAREAHTHA